jgi:hypothetical protein
MNRALVLTATFALSGAGCKSANQSFFLDASEPPVLDNDENRLVKRESSKLLIQQYSDARRACGNQRTESARPYNKMKKTRLALAGAAGTGSSIPAILSPSPTLAAISTVSSVAGLVLGIVLAAHEPKWKKQEETQLGKWTPSNKALEASNPSKLGKDTLRDLDSTDNRRREAAREDIKAKTRIAQQCHEVITSDADDNSETDSAPPTLEAVVVTPSESESSAPAAGTTTTDAEPLPPPSDPEGESEEETDPGDGALLQSIRPHLVGSAD